MRSVSLLLLTLLALLMGSSLHKKLSYDEYPNLYYGYRFITEGPLAVPDGQRMPVMALSALGCASYQCDPAILDERPAARMVVRLPSFFFALLLGLAVYAWTRELYGHRAGLLTLALYVFNPNFIAHGKQVTSDIATCFFFFVSVYSFWKYLHGRKPAYLFLSAFLTAATLLSKYSGTLLFGIFILLWLWDHFQKKSFSSAKPFKAGLTGLGFCFLVLFLINAGYLFKGSFMKTNEYPWQSKAYQKLQAYALPVPVPRTFALGMDYTSYIQENPGIGRGNNYILGHRRRRGRWYSFPIMVLLKTPVAFFLLLGIAAWTRAADRRSQSPFLLIPFLVWLVIFSTLCDVQLGVRYVLPAFVFLIVFAGRSLAGAPGQKKILSVRLLLAWYVLSSLSYYPHFISYFNEAIGERINAYKYLSDSNLDWEDKSYWIEKFQKKHPELQAKLTDGKTPQSGYLIVGANDYTGVMDEAATHWLRHFQPLQHIAYSHYLFSISPEKLEEALKNPS